MFHIITMAMVITVWGLMGIVGVLAIATERVVIPWQRGRTLRPRIWGCGAVLACAGMALFLTGSRAQSMTAIDVLFGSGMVLFITGSVLQFIGTRPGRIRG